MKQRHTDMGLTDSAIYRSVGVMLLCFLLLALSPQVRSQSGDNPLPTIGGVGGGLISEQQESDIGRQVMMSIRRSAGQIEDPLVYDYLSAMVYRLVPSAPLNSRKLTLVVIDSPDINAFA